MVSLTIPAAANTGADAMLPISRSVCEGPTRKFCLRTRDGHEIESVIIPMRGRGGNWQTLCVSTQIGCARGCTFCQTARMGLVRNLTVGEIVAQTRAARVGFAADVRNLVFMGMGEPLDNLDNVIAAIRHFHEDREHQIPRRRITVSTVGKCAGIRRLAALRWRRLNLAVSLNAPNDEIRSQIMPINHAEPMADLRRAMAEYPVRAGGHVLIAYVLIRELNDRPEHARQLVTYLKGLPTCVNLIPFNACPGISYRTPSDHDVDTFQQILMDAGQMAFRRNTKGRDILGACGQLGKPPSRPPPRSVRPPCRTEECGMKTVASAPRGGRLC